MADGPIFSPSNMDPYKMVERVEWLSPIDYEILSFYEDSDILASSKVIAANIDYSRKYTSRRLRALSGAGLLRQDDETKLYQLSEMGRAFLAGDLDADDLETQ